MSEKAERQLPLPKRLKEARVRIGRPQKTIGIMAGIDEFSASARVNQYEKGKHAPDYAMVSRLDTVLKVHCSYLYEENDDISAMLRLYYQLDDDERKQILERIMSMQQESIK